MSEVGLKTIFVVGDSRVGKTTVVGRILQNQELQLVSSTDKATEYRVFPEGRKIPIKVLEIRNSDYLIENAIEADTETSVAVFCFSVDIVNSLQHVVDLWYPLFSKHVGRDMIMVLIGNKFDLGNSLDVNLNLALFGLKSVINKKVENFFKRAEAMDAYVETGIDDSESLVQISELIKTSLSITP